MPMPKAALRILVVVAVLGAAGIAIVAFYDGDDEASGTRGSASSDTHRTDLSAGGSAQPSSPLDPAAPASAVSRSAPARGGVRPEVARLSPSSGGSGTQIVIEGANFARPQVLFGSSPAQVVNATGSAVTVVVPDGKGTVSVVVTNPDGTYAVAGNAYTCR